jgi:hypothetical protein
MPRRHWPQEILTAVTAGATAAFVAIGTAPAASAHDAALAGWLTKAFDPIQQLHTAENALIPLLALDPNLGANDPQKPIEDVNALKQPCDQLKATNETMQGLLPTPDPGLTTEFQQAVDSIDTAVENCATAIRKKTRDREKVSDAVLGQLGGAEAHLASADIILGKLSASK